MSVTNYTVDPSRLGSYEYDSEWVICPFCKYEQGDCWEWVTDREQETDCPSCGGTLKVWAEHSVTYYAKAEALPSDSDRPPQGGDQRAPGKAGQSVIAQNPSKEPT